MSPFRTFLALIPVLLLLASCNRGSSAEQESSVDSNATVSLYGQIAGGGELEVLIEEVGARAYIPLDTVICDAEGNFFSSWESQSTAFYVIRFGRYSYHSLLALPGEEIRYMADVNRPELYSVKGSEGSALLAELNLEHRGAIAAMEKIASGKQEALGSPDFSQVAAEADREFDSVRSSFHGWSENFIHSNPSSPAILVALYNLYGRSLPVFDPSLDMDIYLFSDSCLMEHHPGLEASQMLHRQLQQLRNENQQSAMGGGDRLEPGTIAPDFVSRRPDGSSFALSELKGSYVLMTFWASWSPHCLDENKILDEAYRLYQPYGLQILQVSLDDDPAAWKAAIGPEAKGRTHISDLLRWDSPAAALYHIERIPESLLIDPQGKIVLNGLHGKELLTKLEFLKSN